MAENDVAQHEGNCRPVLELKIEVAYLKEELKGYKDKQEDMVTTVSAVALDNATLKANMQALADNITNIGKKFDKATWAIIAMFGSILLTIILQAAGVIK